MADIETRVKTIIMDKLGVGENEVTPTASFIGDLGADSLDTAELIMGLEDEFNVKIEDSEAENIRTVGDAVSFIESKVNQ